MHVHPFVELLEPPHLDRWRQQYGLGELTLRHPQIDGGLGKGGEVADFGDAQQLLGIGHYGTPLVGRSTKCHSEKIGKMRSYLILPNFLLAPIRLASFNQTDTVRFEMGIPYLHLKGIQSAFIESS